MKSFVSFVMLFLAFSSSHAGVFSSFENPPISFSMRIVEGFSTHIVEGEVHITNTSDEVIHAVVATTLGGESPVVLADTIEPYKTVTFPANASNVVMFTSEFKVTCKGYGTMRVKIPIQ